MPATYGLLHLSVQEIIGLAVVAVLILIITTVLFRLGQAKAGWFFMIANIVLFVIVMNGVWDAILQKAPGLATVFWTMTASIAVGLVWLVLTILSIWPKQKLIKSQN